ncbi:NAD(P)H-quinone oxidoreductase subunit U, chloroplastic [Curcuma longa]|uniref:NAD(P)H-quinone oxidoreductase subunit U, chloroplastic n=1 Tax=Curcuma longa TaxID=136217 RepID=UPI003D9E87BA
MAAVALQSPPSVLCSRRSLTCFRPPSARQHLSNRVRSSAEAGSDIVVEKDTASPPSEESPVETQKRPSSLISAANVQKALRGLAITDADHYGRLGIARKSSYGQVKVAYENKYEELMNKGLDEAEKMKELELLKESYDILSSEEERRLYDWSLVRSEKPDRYVWPFEVDRIKVSTELPPAQEPEDVVPTRLVGYFFLAWLILSVVLSVTINR